MSFDPISFALGVQSSGSGGGGGGGGGGYALPPFLISGNNMHFNGPAVSGFTSDLYYILPTTGNGVSLKPDCSKPWEIMICFSVSSLSANQALFGTLNSYWDYPSVELTLNSGIFCGYSTNGTSWTDAFAITTSDYAIALNEKTYVCASWDGTDFKVKVWDATHSFERSIPVNNPQKTYAGAEFKLAGINSSGSHCARYCTFYLDECSIKVDGQYIWGGEAKG